jgi:hypothetical protein
MRASSESKSMSLKGKPLQLIADDVSSHVFEDQLVIFSESTQKLYSLNSSAAFIWLSYEHHRNFNEVVDAVIQTYGLDSSRAQEEVTKLVTSWVELGLFNIDPFGEKQLKEREEKPSTCEHSINTPLPPPIGSYSGLHFSLLGKDFLIRCAAEEISNNLLAVFAHLESDALQPAIPVDIVEFDGRFYVYHLGSMVFGCLKQEHVVSAVTQTLLQIAYRYCDFLIAVHAAVLSVRNQCVIFPGESGAGKTTLATALVRDGFQYLTDEVALLDRSTGYIIPVPVSLRIKESAWEITERMFPDLANVRRHVTLDGQRLRYLPPPAGAFARDLSESCPARWLVFPRYVPNATAAISSISRIEALGRLQSVGYEIHGHLDRVKINELLSWVKTVDCYEMTFDRLEDAVSIIRSLVG